MEMEQINCNPARPNNAMHGKNEAAIECNVSVKYVMTQRVNSVQQFQC